MNRCTCQMSSITTKKLLNRSTLQPSRHKSVILLFSIDWTKKKTVWNYFIPYLLNCENLMGFKLERHLCMIFSALSNFFVGWNQGTKGWIQHKKNYWFASFFSNNAVLRVNINYKIAAQHNEKKKRELNDFKCNCGL